MDLGLVFGFLDVFMIPLRRRVAESELESAKITMTGEVIDLATKIRVAFFTYQAQQQQVELFKQVEAGSSASVEAAKSLYRAGNVTELEVATERVLLCSPLRN